MPNYQTYEGNTHFGYTGQYQDLESVLQYMRARYYDLFTPQFLSRDPLEGTTKQLYGYANGPPSIFSDIMGMRQALTHNYPQYQTSLFQKVAWPLST